MFGLGLGEIILIMVAGLIILGPKRLPLVARTMGTMFGRAQNYINSVKTETMRQMEIEELRHTASLVKNEVTDLQHSIDVAAQSVINVAEHDDDENSANNTDITNIESYRHERYQRFQSNKARIRNQTKHHKPYKRFLRQL